MVIMIHTGAPARSGVLGNNITSNGKYGVQIFFVISGFTVARTFMASDSFASYFGRRLLRIAPLYYAIIILGFALIFSGVLSRPYWMTLYDGHPDAYNLFMHLTFLSGWDARVANSLIGVEWSIPIEVFWYAVLPLLLPIPRSRKRVFYIFCGLLVLSGVSRAIGHILLPPHAAHFLPLTYGAYFYLGVIAEHLRPKAQDLPIKKRRIYVWLASLLFILGLVTDTGMNAVFLSLATAGFIIFRSGHDGTRGVLCLRPVLFLGSISYSLYLLHPLAITAVRKLGPESISNGFSLFISVTCLTALFSSVTYGLIEHPSNKFGKKLFGPHKTKSEPRAMAKS
jgi:peptidoglycan/LPS O-acetylase OafA/YrhL